MKKTVMFAFVLAAFLIPGTSYSADHQSATLAEEKPPNPNGWYGYDDTLPDLLDIKGLTYHEARPIIMGAGWSPLQTLKEGTEDFEQGAESGNGPKFWKKGYHELQTCAGSGVAYCSFLFQNKNGDRLRVVTKYEEYEGYSSFAKVAGYRFNP